MYEQRLKCKRWLECAFLFKEKKKYKNKGTKGKKKERKEEVTIIKREFL